jgi:translation elongation factor P/translation initiation factor 5A
MKNKSPEKMLTFMDVETKENVQISIDQINDSLKQLNLQIEEQIIYSLLQKGVKSKSFDSEKPIVQLIKETI